MIVLIVTALISLGINIYQALKLFKYKDDKKLLILELFDERHNNEISKSVITNLVKKVQEYDQKYTDLRSDTTTEIVIEDKPVVTRKPRKKK